jgi:hypothetical protein
MKHFIIHFTKTGRYYREWGNIGAQTENAYDATRLSEDEANDLMKLFNPDQRPRKEEVL